MTRRDGARACTHTRARHQHGTKRAYDADRCGCLLCRAAHARAAAAYRAGGNWTETDWPNSAGTTRRLRALAAIGITSARTAELTGLSPDMVSYLRRGRPGRVTPALADAVRHAYDQAWHNTPTTSDERRCATQAARLGYVPPLAWDEDTIDDPAATPATAPPPDDTLDEVLVDRITCGHEPQPAASPERTEAVRRMAARGNSDGAIARRTRLSVDAVLKIRTRAGIPAGQQMEHAA